MTDQSPQIRPDGAPVLAELRASAPRRVLGVGILAGLGGALIYLALATPSASVAGSIVLLGFGALCLWVCLRMWQATAQRLVLTREDLRDSEGRVLARVDQIRAIRRGVFAFKPAGGFTVSLSAAGPSGWAPGLWWRLGRTVGVGGVSHRHEARYMAEVLEELIRSNP